MYLTCAWDIYIFKQFGPPPNKYTFALQGFRENSDRLKGSKDVKNYR